MGADAKCRVTLNGKISSARVRLETALLQLRADDVKLDLPFKAMKEVVARDGVLSITHDGGSLTLDL